VRLKDKLSKKRKPEKSSTEKIKNEVTKEIQEDKELVVGHAKHIKSLWKSKEVIQLKTDAIAVLWKKRGHEEQFFDAFNKITKEGYQLVLTEAVKAVDVGPLYMQMGSYYYFQHRNFIK
jgi:chromosomal replication initiation ATPase DnaA